MGACTSLPSFKTPSQQTSLSNDLFDCAVYSTQGHRPSMEDTHFMTLSLPKHPSYALFAVFDGFNGDDASTYFAENIEGALDTVKDLDDNDAIITAITEMDTRYIQSHHTAQYNPNAGCTFVFAILNRERRSVSDAMYTPYSNSVGSFPPVSPVSPPVPSVPSATKQEHEPMKFGSLQDASFAGDAQNEFKVRTFWAGDSRATLMSANGLFTRLTNDHLCSVPKEAERILNAKGTITNYRIDGIVEVTRCFGCHAMKNDDQIPSTEQKMISVPEYTATMCRTNDRLLIFCDGLTKKWTDRQFNTRCKHHVMQHEDEMNGGSQALMYLCEQAMDEGSKDNITVLSIKFK